MIKACGFVAGLAGDSVMMTVVAQEFKRKFPYSHLTFALGNRYGHLRDLFIGNPDIDAYHTWETYDNWPTAGDQKFLDEQKFDAVFNPFPSHTRPDWYNFFHYTQESCLMFGLPCPQYGQCKLGYKPKKANGETKYVALSLFASGQQHEKSLTMPQKVALVAAIKRLGYESIQLGSNDDQIEGASKPKLSITGAVDCLVGSVAHISIDTSFAWIGSAYSKNMVGLYGINYGDMTIDRVSSHNPINANAIYINKPRVQDISIEEIIESLKKII